MYLAGFIFVLGCTLFMCFAVAFIQWVLSQVGVTIFLVFLVVMTVLFFIVQGERKNEK